MTKHHFSLQEVFMFGWNKTKQHAWFVVLAAIIISIIINAVYFAPLLNLIVTLMVTLSVASLSLQIVRNHSFTFSDLFTPLLSPLRVLKFFALLGFYIIPVMLVALAMALLFFGVQGGSASMTVFGLVMTTLLLIPSIYITIRFNFFPFVVVEHEHATVPELIRISYKLTEKNFWSLFLFLLCAAVLNMLGMLALGVGLLVTMPVTLLATAYLYDRFKNHETLG